MIVRNRLFLVAFVLLAAGAVGGHGLLRQASPLWWLLLVLLFWIVAWLAANLANNLLAEALARLRDLFVPAPARAEVPLHPDTLNEEIAQAIRDLTRERNRLESVLQNLWEGVIALDGESGRITLINETAVTLLGLGMSPVGRRIDTVLPIQAMARMACLLDDQPKACNGEFEVEGIPPRRLLAQGRPMDDGAGSLLVLRDVTEVRRLELVRRDFVANVSHELRTPVTVVLANTETLLMDPVMEDLPDIKLPLEAIHRQSQRLARLIKDLLDLSRLETGVYPFKPAPHLISEVVQRVSALLEGQAMDRQVTVHLDIPREEPVKADARALEQVLHNLVDNAIKYTPTGSRVTVRFKVQEGFGRVEVEDNGPGIPAEHHHRLFERFYRVDTGRSRHMGGTGLGLAIVKHLVDQMGGKVGVESLTPQGTRFWFLLPLAVAVE